MSQLNETRYSPKAAVENTETVAGVKAERMKSVSSVVGSVESANGSKGVEVTSDQAPSFSASRRNLTSGIAAAGALLAAGLFTSPEANAHTFRRIPIWRNGRLRWKKIRLRRHRHGGGNPRPCFLKGTCVRTDTGDRPVESLAAGDLLMTVSGDFRPLKWVGKSRVARHGEGDWAPADAPVKVAQGALDGRLPERDLYVSGSHCLFVEGMLIPASQLVNGKSITLCTDYAADAIELFHLELDVHDVLIAEGAPAESLLATAECRRHFDNYAEFVELFGTDVQDMEPYAPLVRHVDTAQAAKAQVVRVIAPIIDRRAPLEVVRDAIDELAFHKEAA